MRSYEIALIQSKYPEVKISIVLNPWKWEDLKEEMVMTRL